MKRFTTRIHIHLQVYFALILIFYLPAITLAVEPIGTIGQQLPEKHAFLSDDKILRVVQTHIEIVDANTGEVVDQFAELQSNSYIAISPSVEHLAILSTLPDSDEDSVQIWDINAKELISEWQYVSDAQRNAAFNPTSPMLVIAAKEGFHLWNWQTGEFIGRMIGERRSTEHCYVQERGKICGGASKEIFIFSPDGRYLIVASRRPDIEVWNVETRELEGHFEGVGGNWVEGVAISPDGRYLASFDREPGVAYVWDFESRQLLWQAQQGVGSVIDVSFSPDSQRLYVTTRTGATRRFGFTPWEGWDDTVRVWDVASREQIDMFDTEFKRVSTSLLSPNEKRILLSYLDGVVLWDIEHQRIQQIWVDFVPRWSIEGISLSPDGKSVVLVSEHFIKIWDVASQQLKQLVSAEGFSYDGLAISADSQHFAVGKYHVVELRDIHTGKIELQFPRSISDIERINYGQSGRWFAVSDRWDELAILDTDNPDQPQVLHTETKLPDDLRFGQFGFSEDDLYFAASGVTGKNNNNTYWILLWKRDGDTFKYQYGWQSPGFGSQPAFTTAADGSPVLAAPGYEIIFWKLLPNGPKPHSILNAGGPIQFSPDGRYLFANREGYLQIWDWQTNKPIRHEAFPVYAGLSRDGSVLISYRMYGQYDIWDTESLTSHLPYPVDPKDKQIVTLGEIKRNQLLQNFPNPFNPETWIPFRLADDSRVTVNIYTPSGKLIRSLSLGKMTAGDYSSQSHAAHWDGRNDNGESVSSGVYLYTIHAGGLTATRKMLIRK